MNNENGQTHKMNPEELFEQKLSQLGLGYPQEANLADVPEQEARLLRLAAALRYTPFPDEDEEIVARQRAELLQAARALTMKTGPLPGSAKRAAPFLLLLDRVRAGLDGVLQRRELAVGMAAVLIVVVLLAASALFRGQGNGEEAIVAEGVSPSVAETEAGSDMASVAAGESGETAVSSPGPAVIAGAATPGHQVFLPVTTNPLESNPQTAVLETVHGVVEMQTADGNWTAVPRLANLSAGQRIRTGSLSRATLAFYDGSQATLGANSELTIDQLDAQLPEAGFRTIALTQHLGESEHNVQFRDDGGSRYEVNTPAGSGIARGTQFRVVVTPDLWAQFLVSEGRVDVSGLSQMVSVVAGQTTAVLAGSPPETPNFRISGEGEVSQIGAAWIIAGQSFQTHDRTIIVGNPQIGDLVRVEGRLLDDGSRRADSIVLLRKAITNRFTLTGEVETIADTVWTIAGQTVLTDNETQIDDDIAVGDSVRVQGILIAGGTLRAERIERVVDQPGLPFHFTGLVETMGADGWTISGVMIAVNADTTIDDGLAVGDLVEVRGQIQDDGTWLARRIQQTTDDLPEFSFTGRVQSIDPWQVAGIAFETRQWTAVEPNISVGDRVRVRGVILTDGTWVASHIDRLGSDDDDDDDDDDENNTIVLVGVVSSIDPWIVNGLQLMLTDDSRVQDNIMVGDVVLVRLRLTADGMWQVISIRPLTPQFGLGCLVINTTVLAAQSNQLVLQHWPNLSLDDDDFDDVDDIEINSVVTFPLCFGFNSTIIFIGPITIIYQPIIIIVPPSPQLPQPPPRGGGNNSNNNNNG